MAVAVALALVVGLVLLDRKGGIDLTHPAGVLVTACLFLLSTVYTLGWLVVAIVEGLSEQGGWGLTLLGAAAIGLSGAGLGLYVLLKGNLRPRGETPADRARRLLADGLAIGLPLQVLLIGGYLAAALALHDTFQGPAWMLPFYPMLLALLWPMMHLVFHVALAAIVIDPLIILTACLVGVLWTAQSIFLAHGSLRGDERAGKGVLRAVLAFVPIVNLVLALRLYGRLGRKREAEV